MGEGTVGIELEPVESALQEGWMVMRLTKVWGSVKMNLSGVTREIGNSFEPANGMELKVVIPQHPGAGTQPENTVTLMEVYDISHKVLYNLEQTILDNHKQREDEKEGNW